MARPKKNVPHRLPRWHAKRRRWRLTIEHHHGTKDFWYEGEEGPTPPPSAIAAAVGAQDQWNAIKRDWNHLSHVMRSVHPEKDWTRPVWLSGEEVAKAKQIFEERHREFERAFNRETGIGVAFLGITGLADVLTDLRDNPPGGPWKDEFAQVLSELRPIQRRAAIVAVTVEDAIHRFVTDQEQRLALRAGDTISPETFNATRGDLLRAFGLSSGKERLVLRKPPIDATALMHAIDRDRMVEFARYWQRMPDGVTSTRTVKNVFAAVRQFLKWAARQRFGFERIEDVIDILKADDTKRSIAPFDPALLKLVLAHGRARLKLYCLLGLTCGYYPKDIAMMQVREMSVESNGVFIKRERCKESGGSRRKRKGERVLNVKHWIAPEIKTLIDKLHHPNSHDLILLNRYGLPMYRVKDKGRVRLSAAAKAWDRARERSKLTETPSFAQLRKMGYNAIKRIAGKGGKEVADVWAGHSSAIGEHYDDGVYQPSIDAQRVWADELRSVCIM